MWGVGCVVQVPGGNLTCVGRKVLGEGLFREEGKGGVRVGWPMWNAWGRRCSLGNVWLLQPGYTAVGWWGSCFWEGMDGWGSVKCSICLKMSRCIGLMCSLVLQKHLPCTSMLYLCRAEALLMMVLGLYSFPAGDRNSPSWPGSS